MKWNVKKHQEQVTTSTGIEVFGFQWVICVFSSFGDAPNLNLPKNGNISQNNHLPGEDYGVYHDSWDLVLGFFRQTHGFALYSASGSPICLLSLNCTVRAFSTVRHDSDVMSVIGILRFLGKLAENKCGRGLNK